MRRAIVLALLVLAGCGTERTVAGDDIVVRPDDAPVTREAPDQLSRGVRIAD